jgi:phage gp36-like protein
MSYITSDDLDIPQDVLIQLTDDELAGTVNADRVSAAITNAQAEVDSFVAKRYLVPIADPVPVTVKNWTIMLTKYHLYARRSMVPDDIKDALARLLEVSKGTASLGIAPIPQGSSEVGGVISGPDKIFGRDKMRGF